MGSVLAITNDHAGSSTASIVDDVVTVLRAHHDVNLASTSSADEVNRVLREHPDVEVVAALGGDGSLHAVVAQLHQLGRLPRTAVALVPLGTGNDFARTLGLPEDPVTAAGLVATGSVRPFDLILDGEGQVVVNAAHVGIGAEAAAAARPWKKLLGPVGYAIGAVTKGLTTRGADVTVTIDGVPLTRSGRIAQVAVGNGRFVGGGTELLPHADPADDHLDVMVSFSVALHRRLAYAWQLRRGQHPDSPDVLYRRATSVAVSGDHLRCTSDGELTDRRTEHSWQVVPQGLRLLVPSTQPINAA